MAAIKVDSHVHVWSDNQARFPLQPLPGFGLTVPGSVELLLDSMDKAGVDKVVLVQAALYGYDHSYALDCRRRFPDRTAAVCLVDPTDPQAATNLRRLVEREGCRGVRLRPLVTPENWDWFGSPVTFPIWEAAAELNVPINVIILPVQMPALAAMVNRFPKVKVVVDHLGRQYVAESPTYPSAEGLLGLANSPNVYVKISALSANSAEPYPYRDAIGLARRVYERFGVRRLMWGTDFPYVQEHEGYGRALTLVDHYDFLSAADRGWLLGNTALGLYFGGSLAA